MASFLFWIVLPCTIVAVVLRLLYNREQTTGRPGLVGALHDFQFKSLVAPRLIKTSYVLTYALTAVATVAWILFGISLFSLRWIGWALPLFIILGAPLVGLVFLTLTRTALEYMIVSFSIDEKLGVLVEQGKQASPGPDQLAEHVRRHIDEKERKASSSP